MLWVETPTIVSLKNNCRQISEFKNECYVHELRMSRDSKSRVETGSLRPIYTVRLCRIQQAYDKLTTGLRHRKRVVGLIYTKQFMLQACRKLAVCDKVVPCKSALTVMRQPQGQYTNFNCFTAHGTCRRQMFTWHCKLHV